MTLRLDALAREWSRYQGGSYWHYVRDVGATIIGAHCTAMFVPDEFSLSPPRDRRCEACWVYAKRGNPGANILDERLPERFWSKVIPEPNSGCWIWVGATSGDYGHFGIGRTVVWSHRHSFETLVEPVLTGYEIDHLCQNTLCCNPAHLEQVTPAVNKKRSESWCGRASRATHCARGHEFSVENTWLRVVGDRVHRQCRMCKRENDRKYKQEARAR